ncbi:hypothetical protein AMTR_s00914p00003170 [Amborella trichopoda]|uniref:Uncharacterized protein n=1 Tax=Amborella trichopoda TaxID=13333 RepID=U5CXV5_AMBTC|nr:hypothetical protein AMTR_s00914p00003170 [Amborella trichopoda]
MGVAGHPWVVLGYFNTVRYQAEKVGGNCISLSRLLDVNSCFDDCRLVDCQASGNFRYWSNHQDEDDRIFCRLDRVLVNVEFIRNSSNSCCLTLLPGSRRVTLLLAVPGLGMKEFKPRV